MAAAATERLIDLFVRGETARLASFPSDVFEDAGETPLLVAALVFSGDFERALAVAKSIEAKDTTGLVAFSLSLGFARAGRYDDALKRIGRLTAHPFFEAQARGFFEFTRGHFAAAGACAREALAVAESSHDPLQPLARILSLDLLGHTLIRTGETRRGIKTLRLALEAARRVRHESFAHAITISLLKYEATFGFEPTRVLARLYRALHELKPNDSYSRAELRLELARQLILRGHLRDARVHLEEAATDVLGSENRLQTAALYLRLAWMAKLEGRPDDALLSLKSAERSLSPSGAATDGNRELLLKIWHFRLELCREMGRTTEARALEKQIADSNVTETLSRTRGLEARLTARRFATTTARAIESPAAESGSEDPFGDLMDRVSQRSSGIETDLFERGYFGLLLPLLGLQLRQTALVLGAPGGRLIVLESGEARLSGAGLKGLLGKLIFRLSEGPCSRREAIETIWGYRYESERHDRLLAVAVSRIRKALGGSSPWLENQGDVLVLHEQVTVRFWSNAIPSKRAMATHDRVLVQPRLLQNRRGLRIRQLQVLDELATRGDVGVQDLVERFGISRASALRDLNELVEMKLLVRIGETRATRYMLKSQLRSLG